MAMGKAGRLTEVQWEQLRAVRDEYKAASLCTNPVDRSAAKATIGRLYELAGHAAPRFIWCESPASALLAIKLLSDATASLHWSHGSLRKTALQTCLVREVEESLRRSLKESLGRRGEHLSPTLLQGALVGLLELLPARALQDLIREPLGDLIRGPLGDSVRDSLPARAWPHSGDPALVRHPELNTLWDHLAGQHDSRIVQFEAPRRLGLVSYGGRDSEWLELWCALARSCGWWWPYERVCVVAERPAVIHAEQPGGERGQLQLHCPDGPAMLFRDGWAVHAWHGRLVPATLVEEGWGIPAILAERNAEIRRCAIEKLGWDEVEQHLIPVASAPDPGNPGQVLTLCDLPMAFQDTFRGAVRLLLCSNGTPEADGTRRRFGLTVPAHHTDPVAAAAETYGWSREEYASLARRV